MATQVVQISLYEAAYVDGVWGRKREGRQKFHGTSMIWHRYQAMRQVGRTSGR